VHVVDAYVIMTPTPSTTTPSAPVLTRDVSRILNVPIPQLHAMLRCRRMREPQRDSSGRFIWTPEDVEEARRALATDRRRKEHRDLGGVSHV
jgi:hypothetical protein